mgnify:CR=1 FL=1
MKVIDKFGNPKYTLQIPGLVSVDYESGFYFFPLGTTSNQINVLNTCASALFSVARCDTFMHREVLGFKT